MLKSSWVTKVLLIVAATAVCASCAMLQPDRGSSFSTSRLDYKPMGEGATPFGFVGSRLVSLSARPDRELDGMPIVFSKRPLYGTLELGGPEAIPCVFVLDESMGTGSGYDSLRIDANLNQDLSDDPRISAAPNSGGSPPNFTSVETLVGYEGRRLPYHVRIWSCGSTDHMHLDSAGYTEGEISFGGNTYNVALVDDNGNGSFNDAHVVPANSTNAQGAVSSSGDTMIIDLNGDGKFDKSLYDTPEVYHVGQYISFGSKCYEISIAPDGRSITVARADVPSGYISSGHDKFSVELLGENGALKLAGGSRKTKVPAGTYRFAGSSFEQKDDSGAAWRIVGQGDWSQAAIEVDRGKNAKLDFGPPLIAEITAGRDGNQFSFGLQLKGQAGEAFSPANIQKNGAQAPAPSLEIRDDKGVVIAKAQFAYG